MNFKQFGLNSRIIENLNRIGIKEPTEIQCEAIPKILEKYNLVAKAQTGSGKTIAFMVPIIDNIIKKKIDKCLILAPTRDLANQIYENTKNYIKGLQIRANVFFGGVSYNRQIKMLSSENQIYIGTPGRILDLSRSKFLNLNTIDCLILDEADEMLDMGFFFDIKKIIKEMKSRKQTLLFSATISPNINNMIKEIIGNYKFISAKSQGSINESIEQIAYLVIKENKWKLLKQILQENKNKKIIIFTKTKDETKKLTYKLLKEKYFVECLHSDRKQNSREKALKKFRNNEIDILIATDVAARGIDIEKLELVINFSLSNEINSYIHRIGRTGRIGNKGKAISFIENKEFKKIKDIERKMKTKIQIIRDKKFLSKENENKNNQFVKNNKTKKRKSLSFK